MCHAFYLSSVLYINILCIKYIYKRIFVTSINLAKQSFNHIQCNRVNLLIMQNGEGTVVEVVIVIYRITKAFASLYGPRRVIRARLSQKRSRRCSILYEQYPYARCPKNATFIRATLRSLDNLSFSEHPRRISSRHSVSYEDHRLPRVYLLVYLFVSIELF